MEEASKISFLQRHVEDVLVLEVAGSLVMGPETKAMRAEMEKALATGRRKLLLNLAGVSYMDSTGLGVLLAAKTSAVTRNVQLKVCCVPSFAARLLAQLQLTSILDVHEQEAAARASFR